MLDADDRRRQYRQPHQWKQRESAGVEPCPTQPSQAFEDIVSIITLRFLRVVFLTSLMLVCVGVCMKNILPSLKGKKWSLRYPATVQLYRFSLSTAISSLLSSLLYTCSSVLLLITGKIDLQFVMNLESTEMQEHLLHLFDPFYKSLTYVALGQ